VRNFRDTGGEDRAVEPVFHPGNQALMAAGTGAAALSVVMLLMLLAAWQASRQVIDDATPRNNRNTLLRVDRRSLTIDHYTARAKESPLGSLELIVEGHMENMSSLAVEAADLRCYFAANSGERTHFDFPLVVDSNLNDLGDDPLPPQTGREFSVRIGEFPDGFASEIMRIEVINVRLVKS